jgi:1,4-dihydroxy-2-naphthoate octaprenyltransferase
LLDKHKTLSDHSFSLKTETVIFFILFLLAAVFGIFLVSITSLSVLFIGVLCFLVGIFYTFGPISLSHMPVGEAFSGVFMGFFIPLLVVESVLPADAPVLFTINFEKLILTLQLPALLSLILVSARRLLIANIMLANNIGPKRRRKRRRYTCLIKSGENTPLFVRRI